MTLGGFIGFLIGIFFGLAQGSAWPAVIWRASVAMLLGGVVLRWWAGVWTRSLRDAHRERLEGNYKKQSPGSGKPPA